MGEVLTFEGPPLSFVEAPSPQTSRQREVTSGSSTRLACPGAW
jgi:hypothetical protein